ncbi:hypothetical protein GE300_12885 [Rhodobacteraceae bacterium 2CG4]|uniref:Uridine phosphorylase n=1 Tax=Halovulum marinum TaxID=2662447 RepID=A0A6L5Z1R6_9RHOB|nr:hypothetical protein [Halovulum marinum]MSU90503.1 hypothetical protein [Halovulum marinum]
MSVAESRHREYWLSKLEIPSENSPTALIIYGTRYLGENLSRMASNFNHVKYITGRGKFLDDLFITNISGRCVAIATAYGAPMAAELVHVFCEIGVDVVIHTGSCGSLTSDLELGTVLVVSKAWSGEGVSQYYLPKKPFFKSTLSVPILARAIKTSHLTVKTGPVFTTSACLMESDKDKNTWRSKGCLAVDMECASVFSVCHYYHVQCAALLWVSDLVNGQCAAPISPIDGEELNSLKNRLLEISIEIMLNATDNKIQISRD